MPTARKLDLHSGLPYWLVVNGLLGDFPQLTRSLPAEEIVIIGTGISGALAAHELCSAGFRCTMLDRRLLSSGSTWASTAQLNYELDAGMQDLKRTYGEAAAMRIYQSSMHAVARLGEVLQEAGVDAGFEPKSSLYLASDQSGARANRAEYTLRKRHGLAVQLLEADDLKQAYGIKRRNALQHNDAAQFDAYRAAAGLIRHHAGTGALQVFTRTGVVKLRCERDGVHIRTEQGWRIRARHVVCAPGYESAQFLPKLVMSINSTYALATQPLEPGLLWPGASLIWETARPYFYMRTTPEGRIMMGGADEPFRSKKKRDALLDVREQQLLAECASLFPHLAGIQADFSWCGTFGETKDALPYIGEYPGMKGVSFALGYGGNGTTFSMIAAGMIRNRLLGRKDDREELFGFRR